MKTNYHTHQVLKTADPKLRKAIISNCNKVVVHCISECILNVLNGNIKLTGCDTSKLQKQKAALRKVSDRRVPLSKKENRILQRGGLLLLQEGESYITAWWIPVAPIECLVPGDRLHGSLFMSQEPAAVSISKRRGTVKKRNPNAEANKIRKHHPMKSGLRCVKRWTRPI